MAIARPRVTLKSDEEPELVRAAEVLPQLCGVGVKDAVGIAATLPERQRAHLAVFCYGRVHLRELAIAIARTLPLPVLLSAAPSDACGRAIYEATRGACEEPAKPATPFRRPVTLATAASSANLLRIVDEDPEDDLAASEPDMVATDHAAEERAEREPELV